MKLVAPFTGAWIEIIQTRRKQRRKRKSHPSRVRGLKSDWVPGVGGKHIVAPFTGAWIEINMITRLGIQNGASHPSRVRGLKCHYKKYSNNFLQSRTLHGCVD